MVFDDEQYYDIPLDDYNVPYVTIEEMEEILNDKRNAWEKDGYVGLRFDEEKGLYYTDYFSCYSPELLYSHLLVEQLMKQPEKIDWKRVTNGYDPMIIDFIERKFRHPLVWIEIADELDAKYVVVGKVATEKSSEERDTCEPYDMFFVKLYQSRLLWFADTMPTVKDLTRPHMSSEDFVLWYMLTDDALYARTISSEWYKGPVFFNAKEFRNNINYIAEHRGGVKAAEIVRKFREDWPDIEAMKLFDVDKLTNEQREDFRQALFEGMDRNLRRWESEQTSKVEEKPQETVSILFTKKAKKEGKEPEITKALKQSMSGRKDKARALVEEVRSWQGEGYIDPNYNASVMYEELNKILLLPFKYGGFRKYYNE